MSEQMLDELDQFELLGMIHGNRRALTRLIHIQFVLILILLAGAIYLADKPPLVIRIDNLGNTDTVANYHTETNTPTDDDVRYFSKRFLDDYIALKSNLVVRQLETSLNMMTPELAKQHLKAMKEQNTVGIVQAAGIRNDINIRDIHIEEIGGDYYVKLQALLESRPLDDFSAVPKTKNILASIVLQKTPRDGAHPYGLLTKNVQILVDRHGDQIEKNLGEVINEEASE